ncbi:MAG: hypothetical protein ACI4RA_05425 [Kiritimatiellia bacterium]
MKGSRRRVGALCGALGFAGALMAADIAYVADGSSGEYCGAGYGVTVNVSAPASGATIEYAASAEGPWSATPVAYVDACADRPVYFRISAPGYDTVVDSRNVTVTPKALTEDYVWGVYPPEDYVYDGTAKEPGAACGDGDPSIITVNDFDVSYADNVNAGTARIVFTGKRNYAGVVEEEFEIGKAENAWTTEPSIADWTYGQTPAEPVSAAKHGAATVAYSSGARPTLPGNYTATFTVPESANYRELTKTVGFRVLPASIRYVADGSSGEYCGLGYGVTVSVSTPSTGATIEYARTEEGPWSATPVAYTNACTARPIFFRISAEGYGTVTNSAPVTITPKALTEDYVWGVYPAEGYVYDGTAKEPGVACGDGDPSIITADDFDVSYADNVEVGTAKIIFTGKNNYAGVVEEEFEIAAAGPRCAMLAGSLAWKLNLGTGCYTAQLRLVCTNGFEAGIENLRFVYQDRMRGAETASALWNSTARARRPETTIEGTVYRYVDLDASLIAAQGTEAVYGVRDVSQARGVVPLAECAIELYARDLAAPVSDLAYVTWTSGGVACALPVTAAGGSRGMAVREMPAAAVSLAARAARPLPADALDASLAFGVVLDSGSAQYCRIAEFSADADGVSGRVVVGKTAAGVETQGEIGANARVALLGAKSLDGGFEEVGRVAVGEDGAFRFDPGDGGWRFFRVRIEVGNVVE